MLKATYVDEEGREVPADEATFTVVGNLRTRRDGTAAPQRRNGPGEPWIDVKGGS